MILLSIYHTGQIKFKFAHTRQKLRMAMEDQFTQKSIENSKALKNEPNQTYFEGYSIKHSTFVKTYNFKMIINMIF